MAINPDHGALPTFSGGDEREFPGRCVWGDEAALEKTAVGGGFAAGTRPGCGAGRVPAAAQPAAAYRKSYLRGGFRGSGGDAGGVDWADPGGEVSAGRG